MGFLRRAALLFARRMIHTAFAHDALRGIKTSCALGGKGNSPILTAPLMRGLDISMDTYHVAVAAEAYAAATFARAGYEVSVQYGANQPGYDLVAVKDKRVLKVSVKGSQNGGWALLAKHKKGRTWPETVERWLENQPSDVLMCFVQFQGVEFSGMPRIYLARAEEVSKQLKKGRNGNVSTCLYERYRYSKGVGKDSVDELPKDWVCTEERIQKA